MYKLADLAVLKLDCQLHVFDMKVGLADHWGWGAGGALGFCTFIGHGCAKLNAPHCNHCTTIVPLYIVARVMTDEHGSTLYP
jgi:hypothetical protein